MAPFITVEAHLFSLIAKKLKKISIIFNSFPENSQNLAHKAWNQFFLNKKMLFWPSFCIWCDDSEYVSIKIGPLGSKK